MFDFKLRRDDKAADGKAASERIHDVIIVGGGPGGLAASLYAARAGLDALIVEKQTAGGQVASTAFMENCPGCAEGSGEQFAGYMERQAKKFGAKITYANVIDVELEGRTKTIRTEDSDLRAKTVIIATGASAREVGVAGEREFRGRGVSYCATCDGPFYKDRAVAVIGGGDSAVEEGHFLARFAEKVTIVHRRDTLRAVKLIQDRAMADPKVNFLLNTVVEAIKGDKHVRSLTLRCVKTGEKSQLSVDGVFVFVGLTPNTDLFKGKVQLTDDGYVITNEKMETNLDGVFAIGDVRRTPLRQVITAAADGAVAASYADRYIQGL